MFYLYSKKINFNTTKMHIEQYGYNQGFAKAFYNPAKEIINIDLFDDINQWINGESNFLVLIIHINLTKDYSPTLPGGGHVNCVIFDKAKTAVQHFEPHGGDIDAFARGSSTYHVMKYYIENVMEWEFETNVDDYKHISNWQGPDVFCQSWSILYPVLFILNPELPMLELYTTFGGNGDAGQDVRYILLFTFMFWVCNNNSIGYDIDKQAAYLEVETARRMIDYIVQRFFGVFKKYSSESYFDILNL
jgi:hypothetical protein